MKPVVQHFLLPLLAFPLALIADPATDAPWTLPRELSNFQALLDRSPFSLPTAEESSPLADRFILTGAATISGEQMVFVMDRTTQVRHMITKTPNTESLGLVEYLPDPDPRRMRATIRLGDQIATISFVEAAVAPQLNAPVAPVPAQGAPGSPTAPPVLAQPVPALNPGTTQPGQQPPRRVIRRRIISGQPGS